MKKILTITIISFLFCQISFSINKDEKNDILLDEALIIDPIHVDVLEDEPTEFAIIYEDDEAIIDENIVFSIITEPLHGQLSEGSLNEYNDSLIIWFAIYTPNENFFGEDSIEYIIINLNNPNDPETGWIYFHVLPVNDLPMLDELTNE